MLFQALDITRTDSEGKFEFDLELNLNNKNADGCYDERGRNIGRTL